MNPQIPYGDELDPVHERPDDDGQAALPIKAQAIRLGPPADSRGTIVAPGSIKPAKGLPVTRMFDASDVIGTADLEADGSGTIRLAPGVHVGAGRVVDTGLGFRVIRSHEEDGATVFDEIEPITVGVSFAPARAVARIALAPGPFVFYPEAKHWWSLADYGAVLGTVRALEARTVLEFGPGSSTLALVEGGATKIDTCEDDPKWLEVHRSRLGRKFGGVVEVHAYTWRDPLEIPALEGRRYDMALIDGPHDTPRRPAVLEYCLQRAAAVLIPTEDHKVASPPLRPSIERLAGVYRASLEIVETGALSGAFALLIPGARS